MRVFQLAVNKGGKAADEASTDVVKESHLHHGSSPCAAEEDASLGEGSSC